MQFRGFLCGRERVGKTPDALSRAATLGCIYRASLWTSRVQGVHFSQVSSMKSIASDDWKYVRLALVVICEPRVD